MHVIWQVLQFDLDGCAVDADAPHPFTTDGRFKGADHMFHMRTNLGASLVFLCLIRRQRLVLRPLESHQQMDPVCA